MHECFKNLERYLHFDIAGFLVIAKRASELGVQVTCHFLLGRWLSF